MTTLICVDPDDVEKVWPIVSDMIDRAYKETDDITPDVCAWLKRRDGLLWLAATPDVIVAAVTTSFVQRRSGKIMRLWACGGDGVRIWKHHLDEIEDYARSQGCVKVCFDGRRGWERELHGYRPTTSAFEKVL